MNCMHVFLKSQNTTETWSKSETDSYSEMLRGSINKAHSKNTALLFSCVPELFTETAGDCVVSEFNGSVVITVTWVWLTKFDLQET